MARSRRSGGVLVGSGGCTAQPAKGSFNTHTIVHNTFSTFAIYTAVVKTAVVKTKKMPDSLPAKRECVWTDAV